MLAFFNMEVLDSKGHIINPATISWKRMNGNNFPYRFREKTGCINPLGVVKFNITDPYSVYLHDTNFKGAFLADSRYYSHGCIRVEDPVALSNALLDKPVDTAFLRACYKDLDPVTLRLSAPVPVFTVYMTAEVDSMGAVQYFRDHYSLLK